MFYIQRLYKSTFCMIMNVQNMYMKFIYIYIYIYIPKYIYSYIYIFLHIYLPLFGQGHQLTCEENGR